MIIIIIITITIILNFKDDYDYNSGRREGGERTFRVGPRRVGPRRVETRRVEGPKFCTFFPSVFSSLSSRGILVVFEAPGALKCSRLEFSGCRVNPGGPKAAGVSHDSPGGGRRKKRAKFWAVLGEGGSGRGRS